MIYADTSALAKLVSLEPETAALRAWLRQRVGEPLATNMIGVVELQRVAARISAETAEAAVRLVRRIDRRELIGTTFALATQVPPPAVRTLDALHIASAAEATDLSVMLSYDARMVEAAAAFGLPVASPV